MRCTKAIIFRSKNSNYDGTSQEIKDILCKIKVSIISKKRDLTVVTPFWMNCYKFAMLLMILEQNLEDNFNQIISK